MEASRLPASPDLRNSGCSFYHRDVIIAPLCSSPLNPALQLFPYVACLGCKGFFWKNKKNKCNTGIFLFIPTKIIRTYREPPSEFLTEKLHLPKIFWSESLHLLTFATLLISQTSTARTGPCHHILIIHWMGFCYSFLQNGIYLLLLKSRVIVWFFLFVVDCKKIYSISFVWS